jgi:3-oxoadipate enol-lactonase
MNFTATSVVQPLHFQLSGQGPQHLVCIHELGGSMDSFAPLLPGLEAQCRILRYDQRGQGRSAKVAEDYNMAQQADDLEYVLASAGLAAPYWLLAVAAGAAIAVSYAARHPDKVAGLILCSPALSMAADRAENLRRRAAIAVEQGMAAITDETLARSWPPQANGDAGAAQRFQAYRTHLLNADARGYASANRALADYVAAADLARLTCPVTLIAGLYDQVRPPNIVAALRQQLPLARYVELPGAHLLPQQVPQALLSEIGASLRNPPGAVS